MRLLDRLTLLLALIAPACTFAAAPTDAAIAGAAQALIERSVTDRGPGIALLIDRGGRVIHRAARGRADLELDVPLEPGHVFEIASITKLYTAALVVKLAQAKRLSLDDALVQHVRGLPNGGAITLRMLLDHSSGMSDLIEDPQPGFSRRNLDTATLLDAIGKRRPDFLPGTRWAYSNAGYIVLGAVIEQVTGQPWHQAMAEHLLRPNKLSQTRYGGSDELVPGRVNGYTGDVRSGRVVHAPYIHLSGPAAAGALLSTPDDLRRFMRMLVAGEIVGKQGYAQMIAPTAHLPGVSGRTRYGLGLYHWRLRGRAMHGHIGQIPGFATALAYLPEADVTIVVLANADTIDTRTLLRRLAAITIGEPYAEVSAVAVSDEFAAAVSGDYAVGEAFMRTISFNAGRLYSQRPGGRRVPLQLTADGELHFDPDELSYLKPARDDHGRIVALDYFEDGDAPPLTLRRFQESRSN